MGGDLLHTPLLTDDERKSKLDTLLDHRFTHSGKLQLPTTRQYDALSTGGGLHALSYEMCRWLGMKPNGLTVSYATSKLTDDYRIDVDQRKIVINTQYKSHPYTAAALLAFAVTTYFVERYDHQKPEQSFVEFATIETGLGLWIVNALKPRIGLSQRMYHVIDTSWFHTEGIQLSSYQAKQYVEQVVHYAHENRIAVEAYMPHILKRCRHLLPQFVRNKAPQFLPEADATRQHQKTARLLWLKIMLVALILTNGIIIGLYAFAANPSPKHDPLRNESLQAINILKKAHQDCLDEASEQQSNYDPNDLFMTRQVDATKTRCESLRNEYNSAIDQFHTTP